MARKAHSYTKIPDRHKNTGGYRGKPPPSENGWTEHPVTALYHEKDKTMWRLYTRRGGGDWINLKLCATGRAKIKANYWLAWSTGEIRFAHSRQVLDLLKERPELYAALETFLMRRTVGL